MSIPCVLGRYTGIHPRLTLLAGFLRGLAELAIMRLVDVLPSVPGCCWR